MRPAAVMYSLLMIVLLCLSSASVIQAQTACTGNAQLANGEVEAGGIDGVDSALVGEWTTWNTTLETRLTLLADGRFVSCATNYTQGGQGIEMGRWSVADGVFQLLADTTPEGQRPQRLKLEKITPTAFRLSGDNFKLQTLLFRKVTPQDPMPYPGHWLVGTWRRSIIGELNQFVVILALGADGRYRTTTSTYPAGEVVDVKEGNWRLTAQAFFFTRDGESEQAYPLELVTTDRVTFIVDGAKVAFNRNSTPLVAGVDPFAGQFVTTGDGQVTLQLLRDGQGYRGTVIEAGLAHAATGQVTNGRLSLTIPGFREPLVVFPFYNTLSVLSFDGTLGRLQRDKRLVKQSETPLPDRPNLAGYWLFPRATMEQYFPGGRFRALSDVGGVIGSRLTLGTYQVQGTSLTIDPECGPPYTRPYQIVGNQLVEQASPSQRFIHTYLPGSAELSVIDGPRLEASLTADNPLWEGRITLKPLDPGEQTAEQTLPNPIRPGTNLPVDPFRNVKPPAGSTVFATLQTYVYSQPLSQCALDLPADGYVQLGCSIAQLVFLSTGRVFFEFVTFTENEVALPPPLVTLDANVARFWLSYRIDGGAVIVGEETPFRFEIQLGRRRILAGELCYDNAEWIGLGG